MVRCTIAVPLLAVLLQNLAALAVGSELDSSSLLRGARKRSGEHTSGLFSHDNWSGKLRTTDAQNGLRTRSKLTESQSSRRLKKAVDVNYRKNDIKYEIKDKLKAKYDNGFTTSLLDVPRTPLEFRSFGTPLLSGYDDCDDLSGDLMMAVELFAISVMEESSATYNDASFRDNSPSFEGSDTSTQEPNIDDADFTETDGEYVYAAYGDLLIVWNAISGKELSRTQISISSEDDTRNLGHSDLTDDWMVLPEDDWAMISSPQKAKIVGLLLHEQRLTVIVNNPTFSGDTILSHRSATQVRLYDLQTIPQDRSELPLLSTSDLHGLYQSSRLTKAGAHIVTSSRVNTDMIRMEADRNNNAYDGMDEDEFFDAAEAKILEVIPEFVMKLRNELAHSQTDQDMLCSNFVQLSSFIDEAAPNGQFPDFIHIPGIVNSLTQIYSFEMDQSIQSGQDLSMSTSGVFLPTRKVVLYSSSDYLFLAGEGYQRTKENMWDFEDSTFLVGYHLLENGHIEPASTGQVPGRIINKQSMDENNGYLRIATTSSAVWTLESDDIWKEHNQEASNHVSIFKLPEYSGNIFEMKQVGKIDEGLGKVGEIFSAIRFMGDTALFQGEKTTYVWDLSNPDQPINVGESSVNGISDYLHVLDDGMMLSVGQKLDSDTGDTSGLLITLLDLKDLENPVRGEYTEENPSVYSSSLVQGDYRGVLYEDASNTLVVPVAVRDLKNGDFDGFHVYTVDGTGISPRFQFSHVDEFATEDPKNCWYDAYLQPRSMIIEGNLVTFNGHEVAKHNLYNGDAEWRSHPYTADLDDCAEYWDNEYP